MSIAYTKLLRRTLALLGAGAFLAASQSALSQGTVTLSGATGNSCSYSQMTVSPNGSISVTCSGVQQPAGAAFAVTQSGLTMPASSSGFFKVTRSGGPAQNISVSYSATGAGCLNTAGSLTFAQGGAEQKVMLASTPGPGYCIINFTVPSGHTVAPASVTYTVGTPTQPPPVDPPVEPPPPVTPPGCAIPPTNYKYQTRDKWVTANGYPATEWNSVDYLKMTSGQIATYDVINPPTGDSAVVILTQGQAAALPSGTVVTEMTVSKCPGVIETTPASCYSRNTFINNNQSAKIYRTAVNAGGGTIWDTQEELDGRGCWSPLSTGEKWYVNVRWTFTSCAYGIGACGFSMQWNQISNW